MRASTICGAGIIVIPVFEVCSRQFSRINVFYVVSVQFMLQMLQLLGEVLVLRLRNAVNINGHRHR